MNDSDQTTVKVHNFVTDYLSEMLDYFKEKNINFTSELALHDIAVLELYDRFIEAKKSSDKFRLFLESLINDVEFLQSENIVKVKMRGAKGDIKKRHE